MFEWILGLVAFLSLAYGTKKFYGWKKYEKAAGRDGRVGTWIMSMFK